MPVVSESFRTPGRTIQVRRQGFNWKTGVKINEPAIQNIAIADGVSKRQTGYRSGPLAPPEREALREVTGWAAGTAQVLASTGYSYRLRRGKAFLVNDRDFELTETEAGPFEGSLVNLAPSGSPNTTEVQWRLEGFHHARSFSGIYPEEKSLSYTQSVAGEMMRQSIPTQPEIDLTLFIGELKDLPKLFARAAYAPRSAKQAGGAYLNQIFGLQPTLSDILKICEVIVTMAPKLQQFRRDAGNQVRRKRYRELWSRTDSGLIEPPLWGADNTYGNAGVSLRYGRLSNATSSLISTNHIRPMIPWSMRASESIRTFATFEYFIPEPHGFGNRLEGYRRQAERTLGSGLTAGLLYDLSPFSWLVDWFLDIGGLLRYQEQVSSNNVVATRCGHVYERQLEYTSHVVGFRDIRTSLTAQDAPLGPVHVRQPGYTRLFHTKQRRRRGSPYSMSPTWDFSTQQWAILGALGLAMSPEVPHLR